MAEGAKARARWALGTMSGTSLDGVDAAMVLTDGRDVFATGQSGFRPYSKSERDVLRAALGQWDGPEIQAAAEVVEEAHAELLSDFDGAEVIGFHGQTVAHDPSRGRTLQVGDGDVLAHALGLPVVWDFRSTDMDLGGEGAPLAPFYHFALSRRIGAEAPMAFLNIGGVANITWLDPRYDKAEVPGACLAFDTGPGNARIDDLVGLRLGQSMDEGGRLAARGRIDEDALDAMIGHAAYFAKVPPKSLDRGDFAGFLDLVANLSVEDAAATLTAATAGAVARALEHCPSPPSRILVGGGGRRNPVLMEMIAGLAGCPVAPVEDAGLDGDMLEAEAFGFLAVRVLNGWPTSAPSTTGVPSPVGGGRVSRPG